MSKAEELLSRYLYKKEDDYKLWGETLDYLNRKEKLGVGSEWVCDAECYSRWYRGGEVTTLREKFLYEILSWGENEVVFRGMIGLKKELVMPIKQFLACFSPVEKETN